MAYRRHHVRGDKAVRMMLIPNSGMTATLQSILLVEDDLNVLDALKSFLQKAGYLVTSTDSFGRARQLLQQSPPDVLLTDVRLGSHNGLQLALVAKDANPQTKIIVFSGYNDPVLEKETHQMGASFLLKPLSLNGLLRAIRGE